MNQDPVYVYTVCGRYTVSLSVFRAGESNTTVKPDYINVTAAPPGVTSLSPKRHRHNGRLFSATITGSGFQPQTAGAGVILWRTTPTKNITATDVNATSQSTLACSLRIPKKARTGLYRVTVINPDGQQDTLAKGFKILT